MPINKPAAISAALLLAISSIAQAETDFDFNQIPAAERQQLFQEIANEINKELPLTSRDGSTVIYHMSFQNGQFIYDAKLDLDKMDAPSEIRSPEAMRSILQPFAGELFCRTPGMIKMNQQIGSTARYHIQDWRQPIIVTVPKGHCAVYRNKTREELAADSVADMTATLVVSLNQRLPIQSGNTTLERVTFDTDLRVMHKYLSKDDPVLAIQSPATIRNLLQQEAEHNVCNHPPSERQNRYYATTFHTTLPGHATPFEITIPKGHCARQR